MPGTLRVLVLEDRPDDAELMIRQLRQGGYALQWERVDTEADFASRLDPSIDLILADYSLPQYDALRALNLVKQRQLDIPFIVVSGTIGEKAATAAMRSGAHDYFFKGNLARLQPAVERELRATAERRSARQAEGEYLRRLKSIFESALDAVVTMDADGRITDWNAMAEAVFGWRRSEVIGRLMTETIIPEQYRERHRAGLRHFLTTGEGPALNKRLELEGLHRDGHEFPVELSVAATPAGADYVFSGYVRDITEQRRSEEAVRRLAAIVECSTDAIISTNLDGIVLSWNAAAERLYGYTTAEMLGQSLSVIAAPGDIDDVQANVEKVKAGQSVGQLETVRRRKDGSLVDVAISFAPLIDARGTIIAVTGMTRDISAAKRAESALRASEERYRRIVEGAFEGIWLIDEENKTTLVNRVMADMLGCSIEEMLGRTPFDFLDEAGRKSFVQSQQGRLEGRQTRHEVRYIRKDGSECWTLLGVSPIFDQEGRYTGALAMVTDITERRRATFHDTLTGLPNRLQLVERMAQSIEAARTEGSSVSLLMIDLDHFKEVNDTFGHQAGDRLLEQVGPRLRRGLRVSDLVARISADAFAALLPNTDNAGAATIAEELLKTLESPFEVEGQQLDIAASIGIATFPKDGDSPAELLRRADIALFIAKRSRGTYVRYGPELENRGASRLALMAELRQAIQEGQLRLEYQPLVRLRDGSLTAVEALVRWKHPVRGMVPPMEFVPFAEKTRLIQPLTRWVLTSALQQARDWQQAGHPIPVAVNISMRELVDPEFPWLVEGLLREAGAQPSWLRLEITEGVIMAEPERAVDILGQLRKLGIRLAVDDFGTGYSSLAYLDRLPVDEIKIDKSFVSQMAGGSNRATIVRASVDLGHSLRLESVAEGVEDARTWDLLAALDCDAAQGYYISRPIPADDVLPWLGRWESARGGRLSHRPSQAA